MNPTTPLQASLKPVSRSLNATAARKLLKLRASSALEKRIDELATLCNQGLASGEQLAEYDTLIQTGNVIAILQAEARRLLRTGAE